MATTTGSRSRAADMVHDLSMQLLRCRAAVLQHLRADIRALDLTEQQARVLIAMDAAGATATTDVADACCMNVPSLSRVVARLRGRGLVRQDQCEASQQPPRLSLTDEGRLLMVELRAALQASHTRVRMRLGSGFLDDLLHGLDQAIVVLGGSMTPHAEDEA